MENYAFSPRALASAHRRRTKSGACVTTVRIIVAGRSKPLWRTYGPMHAPEAALRKALRSAGLDRAWARCALPLEFPWEKASAEAPGSDASGTPD
jgi:hypothetical protein